MFFENENRPLPDYADPHKEEDQEVLLQGKINRFKKSVPKKHGASTFENFRTENVIEEQNKRAAIGYAKTIVANGKGDQRYSRNLILIGSPGSGKTHLAVAIERHVFMELNDFSIMYFPTTEFRHLDMKLNSSESSDALNTLKKLKESDLVVIDDITKLYLPSTNALFFEVIDSRYDNGLPTIAISNLPRDAFEEIDERIVSRLGGNAYYLDMYGRDHRIQEKNSAK